MRYKPWGFHGESKIPWTPVIPALQSFRSWETVKCNVKFYGVKMPAVVFKPFCLRHLFRIKNFFPFFIVKTGAADEPLRHRRFISVCHNRFRSYSILAMSIHFFEVKAIRKPSIIKISPVNFC